MTEKEKKAAMDALRKLLGTEGGDDGPGGQIPQAFKDAWNKIIETYDNDNISEADLQKLIDDIQSGRLTSI